MFMMNIIDIIWDCYIRNFVLITHYCYIITVYEYLLINTTLSITDNESKSNGNIRQFERYSAHAVLFLWEYYTYVLFLWEDVVTIEPDPDDRIYTRTINHQLFVLYESFIISNYTYEGIAKIFEKHFIWHLTFIF